MLGTRAFFSFSHLREPSRHREHSAWHHLDHRPENLALPGVGWGERWVRSPDCAAVGSVPDPDLAATEYVTMYWFREPVERSIAEWLELAERSHHGGRRPGHDQTVRPYTDLFVPLKGYVHPRVRVSADALPCRPARGVHLTVTRVRSHGDRAEELFGWYDLVGIPALLEREGVAGVWTFATAAGFDQAGSDSADAAGTFGDRLILTYLDGDPLQFAAEQRDATGPPDALASVEELRFAGPLRTILPWQYDWFEEGSSG